METTGIELISKERQRQIDEEGFSFYHDDNHINEELSLAAALYAIPDSKRTDDIKAFLWPFERKWWKPAYAPTYEARIKELTKAGALIAAQIDRLIRAEYNEGMANAEMETIID